MQRVLHTFVEASEGNAVRDEALDGQTAGKDQFGRLPLQIDIGTVGSAKHSFILTDVSARQLDSFLVGSLGKEYDSSARTGDPNGLFDDSRSGNGDKDQIGTSALRLFAGEFSQIDLARVIGLVGT